MNPQPFSTAPQGEISSLSCEPCPGAELVVALFEVRSQGSKRSGAPFKSDEPGLYVIGRVTCCTEPLIAWIPERRGLGPLKSGAVFGTPQIAVAAPAALPPISPTLHPLAPSPPLGPARCLSTLRLYGPSLPGST
jgi:hypothetical protein